MKKPTLIALLLFVLTSFSAFSQGEWIEETIDPETGLRTGKIRVNGDIYEIKPNAKNLRDLSNADLSGSYFSVSNLKNANLSGTNMQNVIAYATRFDNADLTNANFTGAELLKSVFNGTVIDGTDFTDAVLDLPQVKGLCERATGKTAESLQCGGLNESYVPASKEQNKFNPGIS